MADSKQNREDHFTDTPEYTFRAIGIATPEQMEKQRLKNKKKFDKEYAEQQAGPDAIPEQEYPAEPHGKPTVWEMVKAAVRDLGGSTTNKAVRDWIQERYPGTNRSTINCQLIAGCVNHPSRVHYAVDVRPRSADNKELDRYFRPARGRVEEYNPLRHGEWDTRERASCRSGRNRFRPKRCVFGWTS